MATFTYNQIKIAVDRAEQAAQTYINVASLQQDFTRAEFEDIKTLKRRIDDHLELQLEEFRGEDGISVESIELDNGTITVTYSDNSTQVFTDLGTQSIINITLDNHDLVTHFEDTTTINHGRVVGEPGNLISDAEIDDDGDITFTDVDGTTYKIGNINNFAENPITAVNIIDGDLFLQLNGVWMPNPVGRVKGDPGVQGILPEEKDESDILVSWDGEKVTLTIERDSGASPIVLDNVPFDQRVADPEDTLSLSRNSGNEMVFTLATGARINLGEFDGTDGEDGKDGESGVDNWGEVVSGYERLRFRDSDYDLGAGYPALRIVNPQVNSLLSLRGVYEDIFADDVTISASHINTSGEAVITLSFTDQDNNPVTSDVVIGEVVGEDAETITDININSDGDIVVTYEKAGDVTIGNVKYDRIKSASLDPISNTIQVEMESGDVISTSNDDINGQDGIARSIQNIIIDYASEGMLSLQMNSGDDILDIGKLRPLRDHEIEVTEEGSLFTRLDGEDVATLHGNIRGTDSERDVTDVLFDGTKFTLVINGDTQEELSEVLEKLDGVEYDHTAGTITFRRGTRSYTLAYQREEDGEHGDWIEDGGWEAPVDADGYRHVTITTKDGVEYVKDLKQDTDYITTIYRDVEDIRYAISSPTGDKTVDEKAGTVQDFNGEDGAIPQTIQIEDLNLWFRDWTDGTSDYDAGQVVSRWIEEFSFDDNGDQVSYRYNTDEDPTDLSLFLRGEDARYPVSIVIDENRNLLATYNDDSTEVIGGADGIDAQYVTEFSRDGDVFSISYNDGTVQTLTIENFDGILPRWITEFTINNDRQFAVRYAGADYVLVEYEDNDLTVVGNADGADAEYITSISRVGDDFSVTWNNETTSSLGSYQSFDGEDARWIESISRVGDDFTVSFNNGDSEVISIEGYDGTDGEFVSDIYIDTNRHLIVEWHDNDKPQEDLGFIDYDEGIENIFIDNDGYLVVEHETKEDVVSSRPVITLVSGVSQDSDILSISTTDGEDPIEVGYVAGADYPDGVYITNIWYASDRLNVDLSDGSTLDAGEFIRREIVGYVLEGQTDNELVVKYTDGTEDNLGNVRGESSTLNMVDAFINQNYELVITLNDPTSPESIDPFVIPNVRGEDGNGIASANIVEGELIFTMDDESEINLGVVQIDFGFAPYNPQTTYRAGQSMTMDNRIYVSQRDGVTESPSQDAGAWTTVRLEGDPTPDAGRPTPITPFDEENAGLRPYLVGGSLRNYYSPDRLERREFEIDLVDGDFSVPLYQANENRLDHQAEIELDPSLSYKWRMRDVLHPTGYVTTWSESAPFTVAPVSIQRPSVDVAPGLDANAMNARAGFEGSAFSGSGSHTETTWQVVRDSDGVVVHEEKSSSDLTSTVLPWDTLRADTSYRVRVRHHSGSNESEWSEWLNIRTRVRFESIEIKPNVIFDGEDIIATVAKPFFKSNSNIGQFWDDYMGREGLLAVWEVRDNTDALVWDSVSAIDILRVQVGTVLDSGEVYKIRVRYESNQFVGPSEWSDYVEFTPNWSIEKPVVSYDGDITEVTPDAQFNISYSTTVNDEVSFVEWQLLDEEQSVITRKLSQEGEEPPFFYLSFSDSERELAVRARVVGRFASSEWSDVLAFTVQRMIEAYVFSGGIDQNLIKTDGSGMEIWRESIGSDINAVESDAMGNSYVGLADSSVRKYDSDGSLEWTMTSHSSSVHCVSVNQELNVYSGSQDQRLRKTDMNGGDVWVTPTLGSGVISNSATPDGSYIAVGLVSGAIILFSGDGDELWRDDNAHISSVNGISISSEGNVYSGSSDGKVKKWNISGGMLWDVDIGDEVFDVQVSVDDDFVMIGTRDVIQLSTIDGSIIWIADGNNGETYGGDVDDYAFTYSSHDVGTVKRISPEGEVVWEFDGHSMAVNGVSVMNESIFFAPSSLTGASLSSPFFSPGDMRGTNASSIRFMEPVR